METTEQLKPRIMLELMPDGTIEIEQYINGARKRTIVAIGMFDIRDALAEQKAFIENAAERKRLATEKAARDLHRKVWWQTAYGVDGNRGQGEGFANKFIGPLGASAGAKPKETPIAKSVSNSLDLLA